MKHCKTAPYRFVYKPKASDTENMSREHQDYKYSSDQELLNTLTLDFSRYFVAVFESFKKSRLTFALQTVNLVLVFLLLKILLDGTLDYLIRGARGSSVFALKILFLTLIIGGVSLLKSSKVLKWQTLYDMSFELTRKWLIRLLWINAFVYLAKEYLNDPRNEK